ncbi:hypothetical protein F4778DRAFT_727881 [Xylariomycetidae sp. FL2044]|nr:hypothetical protein F4778DRAFT_727881 [Xylariomycetidae sp. FL2044]
MRFIAAAASAALFGTAALARPAPQTDGDMTEDVTVTSFSVHQQLLNGTTNGVVDGVSFYLSGEDATDLYCQGSTGVPSEVISCSGSAYSFALYPGNGLSDYTLRLYHALGVGVGFYGAGTVPVYCHAGGGPTLVCGQVVDEVTITIDSLPDSA